MRVLKTKYFSALYDNGEIRRIKSGNTEILRMIFSAVRDRNWGTVNPQIVREEISQFDEGFSIHLTVNCIQNEINFQAEYLIEGKVDRLSFEMKGRVLSSFFKNRIGICVLHPISECAGKTATVVHPDGVEEMFEFPKAISPNQPVKNIRELKWEPSDGIIAHLKFKGDIFEMEDQRNWIDASYKTYCTPLELPFPVEVSAGSEIWQKAILTIKTTEKNREPERKPIHISWDETKPLKIPEIGLGISSREQLLTKDEAGVLSSLPISQLRADIHLNDENWQEEMKRASNESKLLRIPLFLCLYLDEDFESQLVLFFDFIKNHPVSIKSVLPVEENHLPHRHFEEIAVAIREPLPFVKVGTGVNAYFAELNRNRPHVEKADFISFMACPQVHAFDNLSLIENVEGLAAAVRSAKELFPEKPVYVSPITLKQRFNVVATGKEQDMGKEELPSQVDARQRNIFAAMWTLGAIKQLALERTESVDFFETVGWRGIMQGDFYSPNPRLFVSNPGDIYPIFYLFKWLKDVLLFYPIRSSNSEQVDGLVWKKQNFNELILANYTDEALSILVKNKIEVLDAFHLDDKILSENIVIKTQNLKIPPKDIVVIQFVSV